jgi:E3 ubiquitin-protein ligase UBR1
MLPETYQNEANVCYTLLISRDTSKSRSNEIERNVLKVADFRPPSSSTDVGKFRLKESELKADQWFWHYSRNDHNTVRALDATKNKKLNFDLNDTDYMPIEQLELTANCGFSGILSLLSCRMFVRVILKTLEKAVDSDKFADFEYCVSITLHLIDLGLGSANEQIFVQNCVDYKLEDNTVLHLVLKLLERGSEPQISDFIPQVKFILQKMKNNESARLQIDARIDHLKTVYVEESENSAEIMNLKRKETTEKKERRAKLLKRFQSSQDKFIKQNAKDFTSNPIEKADLKNLQFESGQCLVCHEDTNCDSPLYGILISMHPSNLPQVCSLDNQESIFELLQEPKEANLLDGSSKKTMNDPNGGLYVSTCSHLIHLSCYKVLQDPGQAASIDYPNAINSAAGEFFCPLCRCLCNGLLPVIWEKKSELETNVRAEPLEFTNWWLCEAGNKLNELSSSNINRQGQLRVCFAKQIARLNRILNDESGDFLNVPMEMQSIRSPFMDSIKQYIGLYTRLTSTMRVTYEANNEKETMIPGDPLSSMKLQMKLLVYTIKCIEVSERDTQFTSMRLQVARQKLILLQILFSNIQSYIAFMTQKPDFERQIRDRIYIDLQCLMIGLLGSEQKMAAYIKPALLKDSFSMLVDFSLTAMPASNFNSFTDIQNSIQIFWALVITKCFVAVIKSIDEQDWSNNDRLINVLVSTSGNPDQESRIQALCELYLPLLIPSDSSKADFIRQKLRGELIGKCCERLCVPFLRKCVLLYYTHFGIRLPEESSDKCRSDIDNLCDILKIPSLDEMCGKLVSNIFLSQLSTGWCVHYANSIGSNTTPPKLLLASPRAFRLFSFPRMFSEFFKLAEEVKCRRCKTNAGRLSICLFCGEFLCFQEQCCTNEMKQGECYAHSKSCGLGIGYTLVS